MIHHLVLSGGGPSGIATCGAINALIDMKYIQINDLKTIHATSVGTIISLFLCFHKLGVEFSSIRDYIIYRPFHETYKLEFQNILNIYNKKGIYDEQITDTFFKPFFQLLELETTITMLELYKLTGIELYFYALNINNMQLTALSFETTPDLPVIYAIYMSSSVPIVFCPYVYNDQCYIDGGFLCNYPLNPCIQLCNEKRHKSDNENDQPPDCNTILGCYNKYENQRKGYIQFTNTNNIIEYLLTISYNLISYINHILYPPLANANIVELPIQLNMNIEYIKKLLYISEDRQKLYENGYQQGLTHITEQCSKIGSNEQK